MFTRLLLPRYLLANPKWVDLANAIDEVLTPYVDDGIERMAALNELHPSSRTPRDTLSNLIETVETQALISKQSLINELQAMGLPLANADRFDLQHLLRLRSVLPTYWQSDKGTDVIGDMLSYALDIDMKINNLWAKRKDGAAFKFESKDHYYDPEIHTFFHPGQEYATGMSVSEVSSAIGNPNDPTQIKQFPTPYIEIEYTPNDLDTALSLESLVFLLMRLLNYNLVFKVIIANNPLHIRPQNRIDLKHPKVPVSDIIAVASVVTIKQVIRSS